MNRYVAKSINYTGIKLTALGMTSDELYQDKSEGLVGGNCRNAGMARHDMDFHPKIDVNMAYARADTPQRSTNAHQSWESTQLWLQCDLNTGVGVPEHLGYDDYAGSQIFLWRMSHACPICEPALLRKLSGACVKGKRRVWWYSFYPCIMPSLTTRADSGGDSAEGLQNSAESEDAFQTRTRGTFVPLQLRTDARASRRNQTHRSNDEDNIVWIGSEVKVCASVEVSEKSIVEMVILAIVICVMLVIAFVYALIMYLREQRTRVAYTLLKKQAADTIGSDTNENEC